MENLENKMNNSHRKMSPYRRRSWMKLAQEQLVAITLDEQNQVAKLEQLAVDMKLALERENEEKIEEERNWRQSYERQWE